MLSHKAILHVVCLIVVYLYCVRATPSNENDCLLPPRKLGTNRNKTMFICGNISSICESLKELEMSTSKCDQHSKKDKTAETTCLCVYTPDPSINKTCCQYLCATNHTGGYMFYIPVLSGLGFIAIRTLTIYAALALIALLGFGPGGIVAGLPAAWMMAVMPVGIHVVATLQSIGVLGLASKILLFITGGTVGTAGIHIINGYVLRFSYKTLFDWEYCECECN